MDNDRELFEKWYEKEKFEWGDYSEEVFKLAPNGDYYFDNVQVCYEGYQAAISHSKERIAELEAEVKRLHTGDNLKAILNEDTDIWMQNCLEMDKTIKAKDERIAELEKDAERLDWLLETCDAQTSFYISGNECASAEELKDAIDKAMKGSNDDK